MYDNGDNSWIGDKNQKGEWYIAYHAIKSLEALNGILNVGFRKGAFQECEDLVNINNDIQTMLNNINTNNFKPLNK